jgi:hypothetical protein
MALAGAGTGFSFSLILDRQDEVATNKFSTEAGSTAGLDPGIGVDVDIRVLDKIAGIGTISAAVDAVANRGASGDLTNVFGFGGSGSTTAAAADAGDGNQAFMASQLPIRVVFSKNFIVEGFFQSIDITYTKFSRNMVPTLATVQCAMEAFYIGIARASTWWSDAVSNGELVNARQAVAGLVGSAVMDASSGDLNSVVNSDAAPYFNNPAARGQNYGNGPRPNVVVRNGVIVNGTRRAE